MKKIVLFAAAAAMGLASCTSQAPKANLKSDIDSLSYMIGVNQGNGLSEVATTHMGIDSAYVAEFLKGIEAGAAEGASATNAKALAFVIGKQIGLQASGLMFNQINGNIFGKDSETSLSKDNFLAGLLAVANNKAVVTTTDAQAFINAQLDAIKEKAMEKQYADNKAAGEKFLAENATKEGVKTTESGLQYKVIKEGQGEIPTKSSTVKVHYKGTLIDGTEFDSSYKREEPTSFRADRVIAGWTEGLQLMKEGAKYRFFIPYLLGYGANGAGSSIPPYSTLIFDVELIKVL